MVTVVLAAAMLLIGLSATVLPIDLVNEGLSLVQEYLGTDLTVTTEVGWLLLFGGDLLLVAGSLLPGI